MSKKHYKKNSSNDTTFAANFGGKKEMGLTTSSKNYQS